MTSRPSSVPVLLLNAHQYKEWLPKQSNTVKQWLTTHEFSAEAGQYCVIPGSHGAVERVVCGVDERLTLWSIAHLPENLPYGSYHLESSLSAHDATQITLGWQLANYQYNRYKSSAKKVATLIVPGNADQRYIDTSYSAICWARDLINCPANDMHPEALAEEAVQWAKKSGGKVKVIEGEKLLKENYPMIYTVGKASAVPPQLVDIRFPRKGAKKVTLVGKGVSFDTGGLDIKSTSNMKLMKKDMGGAANILALAKMLVELDVHVELRVLLPCVENAISGNAMRPRDIVPTRSGKTVEIGNTDAEGRLILCDALTEADSETPDLLIDCATLTGAARVALGTDIPAFFTDDETLANALLTHSTRLHDPVWRLPLFKDYRKKLDSPIADISNDPESGYGGAITAALFLQEFVSTTPSWLHVDMMAWNVASRAGRPVGGEAMAIRALYALIEEKYGH